MGRTSSHFQAQELPEPTKSYTPKSTAKHGEIESKLMNMLMNISTIILWQVAPVAGSVATIANYSTKFFDYVNCLTSMIDLLNAKDSIDPIIQLMNKNIQEESARNALASIKAKIITIKSRLEEMSDGNLTESNRLSKANIASNTCEEILCLFDNDDYILWDMAVISSSILIPFSAICTQVIKYNYEKNCTSVRQSKKIKGQLLSVLDDYKKQCVLERLNLVTIETRDFCVHSGGMPVSTYGLGHDKFLDETDTDLSREWHRSYFCKDTWDNWEERKTTYESIINYRKLMIGYYETDFDDAMEVVYNQLAAINTTNEYSKKEKKFNEKGVNGVVVCLP